MSRYANTVPQILDGDGKPIVGAKKFFFEPGGSKTPKTIYSDSGLTIPADNPQRSDSNGRYIDDIFLDGIYEEEQQDNSGTPTGYDGDTLWTKDPVGDVGGDQFDIWVNDNTYDKHDIVLASDGEHYESLTNSNQGNDPTTSPTHWRLIFGQTITTGTSTAYEVVYGIDGYVNTLGYNINFHTRCGPSPTINFDSLGAKTIKTRDGYTLAPGVLEGPHTLMYDGTDMILVDYTPTLLIEEEVSGADVTNIDITGLDLDAHKSYRIEMEVVPDGASTTTISLYPNADYTATNYYTNSMASNGAAPTGARTNTSTFVVCLAGDKTFVNGILSYRTVSRGVVCQSRHNQGSGATIADHYRHISKTTNLAANLTTLRFSSDIASGLKIGTRIRIYRGDT